MASNHRSLIEFANYREGLQRLEYFIVGVTLALCAYAGHTLHPRKLTLLSAYTIEIVSLALLILSAGVGLKRIESLVRLSHWNGLLLDAMEKRGALMAAKPNSEGWVVIKYPGRLVTTEEATNWVRELNERINVLHHMI